MPKPLPIAVLISGSGRTLKNFLDRVASGKLDVEVRLVISSHPEAKGLEFAEEAGIAAHVVQRQEFSTIKAFSERVFSLCRKGDVAYVAMAGFIKKVVIPPDFVSRVLNIHPALIPAFCGKGFYGHHVHQAVLDYGAKLSGCTVHFVDDDYDHGPIILQRTVPVEDDDTPDTLAARVFEAECEAFPDALQLLAEDRLQVDGRRISIRARSASE